MTRSILRTAAAGAALAAGTAANAQDLAILGASATPLGLDEVRINVQDVNAQAGGIAQSIDSIDVASSTPTLQDLRAYDAVMVFVDDVPFQDPDALGNVLATYVDEGGGLVLAGRVFEPPFALAGRFPDGPYSPLTANGRPFDPYDVTGELRDDAERRLAFVDDADPSARAVRWVYGGDLSPHVEGLTVINGGKLVAVWTPIPRVLTDADGPVEDNEPFVVQRFSLRRGNVVALNFNPISDVTKPGNWKDVSDGEILITSALFYAAKLVPVCANTTIARDINCNTVSAEDEGKVDLDDPICRFWFELRGYEDKDDYYQYDFYAATSETGCLVPILEQPPPPMMPPPDVDDDGFVRHDQIPVPTQIVDPFDPRSGTYATVALVCDNCPETFNPDQLDGDCDNIGNDCDLCPTLPDPMEDPLNQLDPDMDMVGELCDNCPATPANPFTANPDQSDVDFDVRGDVCDNCPETFNPDQIDADSDGLGDACDVCPNAADPGQDDSDGDGFGNACDTCPGDRDPLQSNSDQDPLGDACDLCPFEDDIIIDGTPDGIVCNRSDLGYVLQLIIGYPDGSVDRVCQRDQDFDGVGDACDNCGPRGEDDPGVPNPLQQDFDGDGRGNACDNCTDIYNPSQSDSDFDGLGNACDNCALVPNPGQRDRDRDRVGDTCDNCPTTFNIEQYDRDRDGLGDLCDNCPLVPNADQLDNDNDGFGNACDNCINLPNVDQADADSNGLGDPCDIQIRGGAEDYETQCGSVPGGAAPWWVIAVAGLVATRRRREEAA